MEFYHVELLGNGYSVPYTYLGKKVDITYSSTSVVISLQGDGIVEEF
ncbi:Mu transposase domain-containing protein [Aliarcobacter lanthieri]